MSRTECHADDAAERCADDDDARQREMIQQGHDVGDVTVEVIPAPLGIMIGATTPTQVGREHATRTGKFGRETFEVTAIARDARQTYDRPFIRRTNIFAAVGTQAIAQHEPVLERWPRDRRVHFANNLAGSRKDLNSSALPDGS